MRLLSVCTVPAFLLAGLGSDAAATTLGLPIFATAPSTIFITNQFDRSLPTPSYTLSLHSTIDTAQGAPELIGQDIDFTWFFDDGFDDGTISSSLRIGGTEILFDPLSRSYDLLAGFPYVELAYDPVTSLADYAYPGIFAGFGPRTAVFPEITLQWALDTLVPTKSGSLYCVLDDSYCEFSNTAGLTDLGGVPAYARFDFVYPEGVLTNASLTFSTVDGRQVAPVPLPAGGALLLVALAGPGLGARRRV